MPFLFNLFYYVKNVLCFVLILINKIHISIFYYIVTYFCLSVWVFVCSFESDNKRQNDSTDQAQFSSWILMGIDYVWKCTNSTRTNLFLIKTIIFFRKHIHWAVKLKYCTIKNVYKKYNIINIHRKYIVIFHIHSLTWKTPDFS